MNGDGRPAIALVEEIGNVPVVVRFACSGPHFDRRAASQRGCDLGRDWQGDWLARPDRQAVLRGGGKSWNMTFSFGLKYVMPRGNSSLLPESLWTQRRVTMFTLRLLLRETLRHH